MKGKPIIKSQAAIHNYHKRFKSYVAGAFRLRLIKENPYERFQDKCGEKSDRLHLTEAQMKRLIRMREESTDAVMNRYLDFFLFQTFTGMAYSNAKSFDYEQHIVTIDGKDYIDGHRIKTGNDLPPTSRRRSEQDSFFFTYSCFRPTTRFYVSHQEKIFSSPDLFFFLGRRIFAPRLQNLDNIKMPEYDVTAIRFGLSLNFEVYIRATAGGGP